MYARTMKLAEGVASVLSPFLVNKKKKGVDQLLTRLLDPLLLTSIKAVNSAVRLNAVNLLRDAYPIHVRTFDSNRSVLLFDWVQGTVCLRAID